MLAAASRKAADAGVAVTFRRGDASAPELAAESVDAIVVRHVTWALPAPADAIRRWAALLRPGGRLVLVEGLWSTGAGLTAGALTDLVHPVIPAIEVQPLTDPALWGGPDHRRALPDGRADVTRGRRKAGDFPLFSLVRGALLR